jgi:hypothetical protein
LSSGEDMLRELIVARGDDSEMLQLIEETFDEVSLTVEDEVALALDGAVGLGRNELCDGSRFQGVDQSVGVKRLVAAEGLRIDFLQQRLGLAKIGGLPGCQR